MARELTDMVAILRSFWEWLAQGRCIIRDRDGRIVPLYPNRLQQRIYRAWLKQAKAGLPLRVIILKSRKMGCSTFIQALFYFVAKHYRDCGCQTLAHTDESTLDIFEIATRMYVRDPEWRTVPSAPTAHRLSFREHGSDFAMRTAGGHYAASGANRAFVHLSELAKYQGDAIKIRSVLLSILNSVPTSRFSFVAIESTANMLDASMEFKNRFERARTGATGYVAVFSPWFEEETYRVVGAEIAGYDDYENWLREKFELDDEQLMWRRHKIADDCGGEAIWFMQDYPATVEEAWQNPLGRVYGMLNREQHVRTLEVDELLKAGYVVRRAVDWGGVDPFVCLWLACSRKGPPRFSIDAAACPETWREFMGYVWGPHGPKDESNHAPDAARYAITHFLCQHGVHIFRELYIPMAAARGETVLEHAEQVKRMSVEPVDVTICDKSEPGSIRMFNNRGLPSVPYHYPERIRSRGEIVDGIKYVQALIKGTHPLHPDPREVDEEEEAAYARAISPFPLGQTADLNMRIAGCRQTSRIRQAALQGYL